MLRINGKVFMNLQEAVQWLLDNNALPYQCTANYVADTEIGIGTIVNPSPAKVRIGSLILFADCKVATVTGITDNGFMVGSQYIDYTGDVIAKLLNKDIDVHSVTAHEIQTQLFRSNMATVDDTIEFDKMETMTDDSWARIFEAIVDDNLHKRFIEGEIELNASAQASFTKRYGKWSLSGTHLMIVLAIQVANGTTWTSNTIVDFGNSIPLWIREKLTPTYSVEIRQYEVDFRASDTTKQDVMVYLEKYAPQDLKIYLSGFTATADRVATIQFDLLIDNE